MRRLPSFVLLLALGTAASCYSGNATTPEAGSTTTLTGDDVGSGDEDSGDEGGSSTEDAPEEASAGLMPLRRLTRVEYDNTVRDLLGDTTRPAQNFPGEGEGSAGFASPGLVGSTDVKRLMDAAEALAAVAVADLPALVSCAPEVEGEGTCAQRFIVELGARAYRRPLAEPEQDALLELYDLARADLQQDYAGGLRVVLQAMLQSPQFLYRWELGESAPDRDGALVALNGHEIASRLSYFLWSTMPDEPLFIAAAAGELDTPAQVEAQARRMLADPRARDTLENFTRQWLRLENLPAAFKSPELFPGFDDALKQSMLAETLAFVDHVVRVGDGRVETLLTAPYSFLDERLATLYGVAGVVGPELRGPVELGSDQRVGLLTHASLLTLGANAYEPDPIRRGKLVRERLVACEKLPPPPNNIPELEPPDLNKPSRERYEQHSKEEPCRSCHVLTDPIGFGLQHYDAIGQYRLMEGIHPIDASGMVQGLDGADATFEGAQGLAHVLADSEAVRKCVARQLFRFGFARRETLADIPSFDAAYAAYAEADYNLREFIVALTTTRSFRYRMPAEGEVLP